MFHLKRTYDINMTIKMSIMNIKNEMTAEFSKFRLIESSLFRITSAPMTPGTQPAIVRMDTINIEPQPLSITARGGKITQSITLVIFMNAKLLLNPIIDSIISNSFYKKGGKCYIC